SVINFGWMSSVTSTSTRYNGYGYGFGGSTPVD
uniref:Alkaline phosphatase n=1 Tax=Oryctolagus cuniculus TaxID=9986 RepID=Q7M2K9_RABIT